MQSDPIGLVADVNTFRYAGNNSLSNFDNSGLNDNAVILSYSGDSGDSYAMNVAANNDPTIPGILGLYGHGIFSNHDQMFLLEVDTRSPFATNVLKNNPNFINQHGFRVLNNKFYISNSKQLKDLLTSGGINLNNYDTLFFASCNLGKKVKNNLTLPEMASKDFNKNVIFSPDTVVFGAPTGIGYKFLNIRISGEDPVGNNYPRTLGTTPLPFGSNEDDIRNNLEVNWGFIHK